MLDPAQFVSQPAPGRDCGTCTLCCKVYDVPSLEKPAGVWCGHCQPGRGCGIHATRPQHCRSFHCLWMTESFLGPEWKPERCKFVMSVDPASRNLLIQLDPGHPAAWKAQPYLAQIRRWAIAALNEQRHVIVFLNKSATVILPDREIRLGEIREGDRIEVRRTGPHPGDIDVRKVSPAAN
ncbi:hypothetical protein NK718_09430 [Alsobacter sp. SYSU M60028]|uniref:Uncharacterized protein n=1 Tax=Alsobacter ponti TaxID=2962936 RepID=A0ABT1LBA9_9HYPH|nr:hypothetical protein [Alsobacter ponti]MCP8938734.1 hypothetical protein [Alsobacter ponti]